jgi:hypothetical protein
LIAGPVDCDEQRFTRDGHRGRDALLPKGQRSVRFAWRANVGPRHGLRRLIGEEQKNSGDEDEGDDAHTAQQDQTLLTG